MNSTYKCAQINKIICWSVMLFTWLLPICELRKVRSHGLMLNNMAVSWGCVGKEGNFCLLTHCRISV